MTGILLFIGFIAILIFSMTSLFVRRSNREYFDDTYNRGRVPYYPEHRYYSERESSFSWLTTIITIAGLLFTIFALSYDLKDIFGLKPEPEKEKNELFIKYKSDLNKDIEFLRTSISTNPDTTMLKVINAKLDSMEIKINELDSLKR